jgi:hypothetical protein
MNLSPVEWSQAQSLLLKLVHVLTPLTLRTIPASFLNRHFFIPFSSTKGDFEACSLKNPVRLMTTLHSVQKEVDRWVEENSYLEEPQAESKTARLSKGDLIFANREVREVPKETLPISKQAQRLISQVQDAIATLSCSSFIRNPDKTNLKETLKKLKPHLDRIIESVEQDKNQIPKTATQNSFRFPTARSHREDFFLKQNDLSGLDKDFQNPIFKKNRCLDLEKENLGIDLESRGESKSFPPNVFEISNRPFPRMQKEEERRNISKKEKTNHDSQEAKTLSSIQQSETNQELKTYLKPLEAISLPGAPFIPEVRRLNFVRKKKKGKDLWSNKEEDDQKR